MKIFIFKIKFPRKTHIFVKMYVPLIWNFENIFVFAKIYVSTKFWMKKNVDIHTNKISQKLSNFRFIFGFRENEKYIFVVTLILNDSFTWSWCWCCCGSVGGELSRSGWKENRILGSTGLNADKKKGQFSHLSFCTLRSW